MSELFSSVRLSSRARAIAKDLVLSGRVWPLTQGRPPLEGGFLRLDSPSGEALYWLSLSGDRLFNGRDVVEREELQAPFVAKTARLGGERQQPVPAAVDVPITSSLALVSRRCRPASSS